MEAALNKAILYAVYVRENYSDFYFVKYFWENEAAYNFAELSYFYLQRDIQSYEIQEHLVSTNIPFFELTQLESPIKNFIVLNKSDQYTK